MHALYQAMLVSNFCGEIGKELNKSFRPSNDNPDGITRSVLLGGFRRGRAHKGLVRVGYDKAQVEMLLRKFTEESTKRIARTRRVISRNVARKPTAPLYKKYKVAPSLGTEASASEVNAEELEPLRFEGGALASVNTLNDSMCKYPIGHPGEKGFAFCGRSSLNRSPYCADHTRLSYQPKTGSRKMKKVRADVDELRRLQRLERT
jgi:GcrA cell cycle regulator